MKLQSWRNKVNLLAVGLRWVWFFMPCLVAGFKPVSQLFLSPNLQSCESAMKKIHAGRGQETIWEMSVNNSTQRKPMLKNKIKILAGVVCGLVLLATASVS